MNGLDQIIEQIYSESAVECDQILAKAKAECEIIQAEYEKKAAELAKDIMVSTNAELVKIQEKANEQAATEGRKKMLNAQQALVSEVTAGAIDRVKNLPDNKYFAVIKKLLNCYTQNRNGEILFGRNDTDRLSTELKKAIDEYKLKIVEDQKINGGGFILRYGEIEENCTFSALFVEKQESVHDKVYRILFSQSM